MQTEAEKNQKDEIDGMNEIDRKEELIDCQKEAKNHSKTFLRV